MLHPLLRRLLVLTGGLAALAAGGCYTPPPGLSPDELQRLDRVELEDVCLYYRADELLRDDVQELAPQIQEVRREVRAQLEVEPPRAELVLYEPSGVAGASSPYIRKTLTISEAERVLFRYPWSAQDERGLLLGTAAHELAEASVLARVTVIDPYLRWVHDGIAELVEHQVLRVHDPAAARARLRRTLHFLAEQRGHGVAFVDLTRWRQIAGWIVRSHRLLDEPSGNLPLDDLGAAVERVRHARAALPQGDLRQPGLAELEALVLRARRIEGRPWREDEARPDDPRARDYLFYNAAFAAWLELERSAPGTVRRFLTGLEEARQADDHVLSAAEAVSLLEEAAQGVALPDLERIELAWIEAVLRAEERSLTR